MGNLATWSYCKMSLWPNNAVSWNWTNQKWYLWVFLLGHFWYWTHFSVVWFEPDQVLSSHLEIWANFPTGSQLADWIAGEPETQMLFTDAWFSHDVFYSVMQAHPLSGGYPSGNHVLEGGELLLRFHHIHQCHGWPRDVLALVYFLAGIWMVTVDIHHHQWSMIIFFLNILKIVSCLKDIYRVWLVLLHEFL